MPSQSQLLVNVGSSAIATERTYGDRNQAALDAMFPETPTYTGELTNEGLKTTYGQIINGKPTNDLQSGTGLTYVGGVGLGVTAFDSEFANNGVPNVAALTATKDGKPFGGGEGAPTNPYVPPLTSPGDGSVEASSQPPLDPTTTKVTGLEYDNTGLLIKQNEFGSGYGSTANPSITSTEIDNQTLGGLISGRSYLNSDTLG
tara:strand:- start:255 stop:860 length:606 start_codon:yes stop_codon:yes gene_type:complete